MRDKRPVDELSIEELERILAIRKREARQGQLQRMKREGRVVVAPEPPPRQMPAFPPPQPAQPPATSPVVENESEDGADAGHKSPPPIQSSSVPRFEDDAVGLEVARPGAGGGQAWKTFVNTSLLLVEIAAVLGLFYIGYRMLVATDELESETRAAQQIISATQVASVPTLIPTPSIRLNEVVLPGGHVFEHGVAVPNYDEVPERYRAQLQYEYTQPVLHRPPPTDDTALQVNIPALNINQQPITQGSDWEALKQGIGQVLNGYDLGDPLGNVVLSAHNDVYGELFRYLDELEPGDQIFVQSREEVFTYEVTHTEIVEPSDVEVLDSQGRTTVTLISCYPYGVNNKRIVVFANRVDASA